MAFSSPLLSYGCDVYLDDRKHGVAATLQDERDLKVGVDAHIRSDEVITRRVTGSVSIGSRLPNVFFGITEPSSVDLDFDNRDGFLDFLASTEARESVVRIRRYDEVSGVVTDLFTGQIDSYSVGDDVSIQAASHDINVFTTELPKNRVTTQQSDVPLGEFDVDVTDAFPDATSIDAPIPIVFGRAPDVPFAYIHFDDVAKNYDYLACEGAADVESVKKDGTPAIEEFGVCQAGDPTTITFDTGAETADGYYPGLFVTLLDGAGEGQTRRIDSYDTATQIATLTEAWTTAPTTGDNYVVREYEVLSNTVYLGRTAIRFAFAQKQDGQLRAITGVVVRYTLPRKNSLVRTQDTAHTAWVKTNVVVTDLIASPTRALEAQSLAWQGATADITQASATTPANGEAFVFSVYLRAASSTGVTLRIREVGGGNPASANFTATTTWTRRSVTQSTWSGLNPIEVSVINNAGGAATIEVWGAQLERGSTPTYHEPVRARTQGMLWSIPNAIKELLRTRAWGLGLAVDEESFEAANVTMGDFFMTARGSIPAANGGNARAQDVLDELLQLRGLRLIRRGLAWGILVDESQTSFATFGSGDTPERNIISVGAVRRKSLDEAVKNLVIKYGCEAREEVGTEACFVGRLDAAIGTVGQEKVIELHLVADGHTADQALQYLSGRLKLLDRTWQITVATEDGALVEPGDVITVKVPRRQPENQVRYSEDLRTDSDGLPGSPWTDNPIHPGSAVAVAQRNPFGQSQPITEITFPAPTATQNSLRAQITTVPAAEVTAIFRIWLRADTTSRSVRIRVQDVGLTESTVEAVVVGPSWKLYEVTHHFVDTASGNINPRLETEINSGDPGVTFQAWGAHLTLEYPRPYVKTTTVGINPEETWQVTDVNERLDTLELDITPYDSATVFDFTPKSLSVKAGDVNTLRRRFLRPPAVQNLTVPKFFPTGPGFGEEAYGEGPYGGGDIETPEADAGFDLGPEGVADSWAIISYTMPDVNRVTHIMLQRRKKNELRWETAATTNNTEALTGERVVISVRKFTAGIEYDIRAVSVNIVGEITSSAIKTFLARGDAINPPTPSAVITTQGTGKDVQIHVLSPSLPDDFSEFLLYRALTAETPELNAVLSQRSKTTIFNDSEVNFNTTYYYFARMRDLSHNLSTFSPVSTTGGTPGILVSQVGTTDLADASVTDEKVASLSADKITTGTLLINGPVAATGADLLVIKEGSGSELAFRDTTDVDVFHVDIDQQIMRWDSDTDGVIQWRIGRTASQRLKNVIFNTKEFFLINCELGTIISAGTVDPGSCEVYPDSAFVQAGGRHVGILSNELQISGLDDGPGVASVGAATRRVKVVDSGGNLLGYLLLYAAP